MKNNKMITTTVCGKFPGTQLKGKEQYTKLYHYTSFETFVKIWLSKKLKFGTVENVNDINEVQQSLTTPCALNRSIEEIKQACRRINKIREELGLYKQISLAKDYDSYLKGCMSPMMWGHYGNKRKGVCIELDFSKLNFTQNMIWGNVRYTNELKAAIDIPYNLNNEKDIRSFVMKNKKEIFFTKSTDWKGENEFRIISKNCEYLDISNAISAIYVTDCHDEVCKFVEELVKDSIEVKLFCYIQSCSRKVPIVTNAKARREQEEAAKNNPNNILNAL